MPITTTTPVLFKVGEGASLTTPVIEMGTIVIDSVTGNSYIDVDTSTRVQLKDDTKLPLTGGTMTGSVIFQNNSGTVSGLKVPTSANDAANKGYVDSTVSNLTLNDLGTFTATATGLAAGSTPTVSVDGTTFTFGIPAGAQGVQGPRGEPGAIGATGAAGYTPVRGTDYWTEADKEEINADNIAYMSVELAKRNQLVPEFANSIEDCVDTSKLYVLPDGYIYAYGKHDKFILENQFEISDSTLNARLRSTGEIQTGNPGLLVTNKITIPQFVNPYTIKIGGITLQLSALYGYMAYVFYYGSSDELLGSRSFNSLTPNSAGQYVLDIYDGSCTDVDYVRLSLSVSTSTLSTVDVQNLFIEFEPKNGLVVVTEWGSTGHAFVPADYEHRIIALENAEIQLENRVSEIEENGVAADDVSHSIPEYWESAIGTAIEKIKAKQNLAGHDCVNFIMFSDMHIIHGQNNHAHNIGKLSRHIMDECDIPLTCFLGDWINSAGETTKELTLDDVRVAKEILSPISKEELCTITGNHDLWFDGNTHTVSMEERYNAVCRHNTKDFHKVFGKDGNYYYVDNVPEKTRFIFLDGNWAEWTVNENNIPSYNSFAQGGYGQDQLQFLADNLKVQSGWSVCIFTHVPPIAEYRPPATSYDYFRDGDVLIGIINAYANKTAYSGTHNGSDYNGAIQEWAKVNISVDYTTENGNLVAMFTGHRHLDEVFTDVLRCPIVVVTTCGGQKLKDAYPRTYNTSTETSLDVVTINKSTKTIYCTRVGAGYDREISY